MAEERLVFQIKDPGTNEFTSRRLRNQEAPMYPEYIDRELALTVGFDRFGDPLIRIAWGQKLFRISNGQTLMVHPCQSWQINGEIYQVGYPRFIVQQKMDPVFVGLEHWDEALQGPKPTKGLYVFLACVQTTQGAFRLPDRILLEGLKALDHNRRHSTLYGSHMGQVPEEASKWKTQEIMSQVESAETKYRNNYRDMIRQAFKDRGNRLFHALPREGKSPDPYRLAQKQRAFTIGQQVTENKRIILTDLV